MFIQKVKTNPEILFSNLATKKKCIFCLQPVTEIGPERRRKKMILLVFFLQFQAFLRPNLSVIYRMIHKTVVNGSDCYVF